MGKLKFLSVDFTFNNVWMNATCVYGETEEVDIGHSEKRINKVIKEHDEYCKEKYGENHLRYIDSAIISKNKESIQEMYKIAESHYELTNTLKEYINKLRQDPQYKKDFGLLYIYCLDNYVKDTYNITAKI